MNEVQEKQEKNKPLRDELGRLLPGHTANPNGRPKGKTLKEFAREFLLNKTDEEKKEWLKDLSKDMVWRMAEGNPHQTNETDLKGALILEISKEIALKNNVPTSDPSDSSQGPTPVPGA